MRLWIDGFDTYLTADIPKIYTGLTTQSFPVLIGTTGGARGGNGMYCVSTTNSVHEADLVHLALDPGDNKIIMGQRLEISIVSALESTTAELSSNKVISVLKNTATQLWLRVGTDGALHVMRGTTVVASSATGVITDATAHYVELKAVIATGTGGSYEVRVDTVTVIGPTSSANTANVGVDGYDGALFFGHGVAGSPSYTWGMDDLYIFDGTGSYNNDFVGDQRIDIQEVDTEGTTINGTPSTGTDNAALVKEATPNGDTDYVTLAGVGDKDTYTITAHPVPGASITCVQARLWPKKADAGTALLTAVLRIGGVDYDHPDAKAAASDYRSLTFGWDRSPVDDTTEFETTTITEIGQKKTA